MGKRKIDYYAYNYMCFTIAVDSEIGGELSTSVAINEEKQADADPKASIIEWWTDPLVMAENLERTAAWLRSHAAGSGRIVADID